MKMTMAPPRGAGRSTLPRADAIPGHAPEKPGQGSGTAGCQVRPPIIPFGVNRETWIYKGCVAATMAAFGLFFVMNG